VDGCLRRRREIDGGRIVGVLRRAEAVRFGGVAEEDGGGEEAYALVL
jgi:hypothetical protein